MDMAQPVATTTTLNSTTPIEAAFAPPTGIVGATPKSPI